MSRAVRFRVPKSRRAITAGELRLMLLSGLLLGLAYAASGSGNATIAFPDTAELEAVPASGVDRVIDGDTFRYAGETIRIADIDTPEVRGRCAYEAELAGQATRRLGVLLAQGPFELHAVDRDEDPYGRKLRVVVRDGRSLGDQLVEEGLARTWTGRRQPWCT